MIFDKKAIGCFSQDSIVVTMASMLQCSLAAILSSPEGELATDEEVHASATPEVSPTPKGEPTRQSILSDGDTILQKADALLKE
jgi:hypothetical protein